MQLGRSIIASSSCNYASFYSNLQKCLAPFGADVHRAARTVDVCILEQESHG
jgi:hypothetical protein